MAVDDEVKVKISAEDQASGVFANIGKNAGALGGVLGGLAKTAGVALVAGFGAMAAEATLAVKAFDEQDKANKQLQAVLESTHGAAGLFIEDLQGQAAALQRVTTYGDEAVESAQALLLTFTNIKGGVFQESIGTILDMSTALGQDLKSSAIQVGKALNDPINGITALSRVGVSFTDQQKEMIKSLVDSGKTMDAQRVILAELTKEFGGSAAAAADTFSGRMAQLKNAVGELQETVGGAIVQAITPFIVKLTTWAQDPAVQDKIKELTEGFVKFAGTVIVFAGETIGKLIDGWNVLAAAMGEVRSSLEAVGVSFQSVGAFIQSVTEQIDIHTGFITFMRELWSDVAQFFVAVVKPAWDQLLKTINDNKDSLTLLAKILGGALLIAITAVMLIIAGLVAGLAILIATVIKVTSAIIEFVSKGINWVIDRVTALIDLFQKLIDMAAKVGQVLGSIGGAIGGAINGASKAVGGAVSSVAGAIGVKDAIITPTGQIVQTDPNDFIFATKNPASLGGNGGIVVNITGNTILDNDTARRLADIMIGQLKGELRI